MNDLQTRQLLGAIRDQTEALNRQADAIAMLAESNNALIDLITESIVGAERPDGDGATYLDGTPQ